MQTIHSVRDIFSLEKFLKARELTIEAVNKVATSVELGMVEDDGHELINKVLTEMGADNNWHPHKFRIGTNTTKSFKDISQPAVKLKESDIFFIDIGPVWDGHEGDYGHTFVLGDSAVFDKIADSSRDVFNQVAKIWSEEGKSGKELYEIAQKISEEKGFVFNPRMKGHRLGDFPHHLFYRDGMNETDETPCNYLWVLEIHILDKQNRFGAFFEDILIKK